MSNAIKVKQNNSLSNPADFVGIAGFENLTPEDFSLPRLVLVQLQHVHEGAEDHPGEWYRTDTNEHIANPKILIIGIAKSRAMFDNIEFDRTSTPICRSDDAIFPRQEFIGTQIDGFNIPNNCEACIFKDWTGTNPPYCQLADNWAGLTEDAAPIVFRLKGSGYKISKQLKTTARVTMAKREPLYISLGSQKQKGDSGVFYTPTFTLVREPVPSEIVEMALAMNGVNLAARAAEVEDFDQTSSSDQSEYTDADFDSATSKDIPF